MRAVFVCPLFFAVGCCYTALKKALEDELLKNYSTNVIPQETHGKRMVINASFHIINIVGFNEREESLTSSTWLTLTWKDPLLSWETKLRYENVSVMYMKQKQIWKPDFLLLNSAENLKLLGFDNMGITIRKDGTVIWEPGQTFKSICEVNINQYPFDSQECRFWFGSWAYFNEIQGALTRADVGLNSYQENGKWEITGSHATSDIVVYDYFSQPTLLFTIQLRRRRTYYLLTVCIPIVILSIVNCLVHILPADSGEKMSFCTTVLLSYLVFISFLNDSLPSTSKTVSLLVLYLILVISLSFLSVVNSVVVLYYWHKPVTNSKKSSNCVTAFCRRHFLQDEQKREHQISKHTDKLNSALCDHSENDERAEEERRIKFQRYARYLDHILLVISVGLTLTVTITISAVMLLG